MSRGCGWWIQRTGCRAAIGGSDQAAPATAERRLGELDAVTDAASPQHPVLLAGHSLGGLIARLYQHARPGRVSGLFPASSGQRPRCSCISVTGTAIPSWITGRWKHSVSNVTSTPSASGAATLLPAVPSTTRPASACGQSTVRYGNGRKNKAGTNEIARPKPSYSGCRCR
jgi:pimeloyl-ACP methyl ester carboxylesterase